MVDDNGGRMESGLLLTISERGIHLHKNINQSIGMSHNPMAGLLLIDDHNDL